MICRRRPASGRATAEPELPLLHRFAIAYLMLPVVIWLAGWFDWRIGVPAAALLACALRRPLSGSWKPPPPSAAAAAVLAAAAGAVMTTAAGGVFDVENVDWFDHRTMMLDLSRHPWPTYLPDPLAPWRPETEAPSTAPLLRYYLGWFIAPGLAGRWLGPAALNWAVPLWTWTGVALVALLFTRRRRGRALVIHLALVFCFGGMTLVSAPAILGWGRGWVGMEWYVERFGWASFLVHGPGPFSLQSRLANLAWAPQHFLPAGLYALLCLQLRRQPRFLAVLGVLLAAAPFWSVFVAVGLLPFLAVLLRENGARPLLRWPNLLLAGPLFGLVTLYLTSGEIDFPYGWTGETFSWPQAARRLSFFYLTEFLLLALLLLTIRPALRRERFFVAAVATLLLAPLCRYDDSNVLMLRASQPALFLLSGFCADAVAQRGAFDRRTGLQRIAFTGLALVLGMGAVTAAAELALALRRHGPVRYETLGHTTLVDVPAAWRRQNVAPDPPDLLRRLLRDPADRLGHRIPDEPLVRSVFDVYLDGGMLVAVKERCTAADEQARFFLHVTPADPDDLPRRRRRFGFHREPRKPPERFGDRCLYAASLPKYPVARIVTGQLAPCWIAWRTEINLNRDSRLSHDSRPEH